MKHDFVIVTSVVILKDDKVLLGKRSPDEDIFPNLWSIVGGKCDVEEGIYHNFIERNAIREVKEEIGVDVEIDDYVESHNNGKNKIYVIYTGHIVNGEPRPLEDTSEVGWFKFEDIDESILCPNVYDILKKCMVKKP